MIHSIRQVRVYLLRVRTRVPLKFGSETLTSVTCARVCMRVADASGREVEGWGETPLSVQWVWPSPLPYQERHDALVDFCTKLAKSWAGFSAKGHALETGWDYLQTVLPAQLGLQRAKAPAPAGDLPYLAALVCNSPFDIALHDACGKLLGRPVYETYSPEFLSRDLSQFLTPARDSKIVFDRRFPNEFLNREPARELPAWHLVGGLDPVNPSDLSGDEPNDGTPVLLSDWIQRDGLKCLKVKLRGTDADWDFQRLRDVALVGIAHGVQALSADFNCTVHDPAYVIEILGRLKRDHPECLEMLLYVEQPFPYELEQHRIDVHGLSAVKPLFLDESAHDWRMVMLGRELGWTGVALKTCKTQTGAILSACWAKAHGMDLMVQDLTNPMLAQIPHVLLAAHVGTIMGVETNSMQFYPAASEPEEAVHPGLYKRRGGCVQLETIQGPGFGYRLDEIKRKLPDPVAVFNV